MNALVHVLLSHATLGKVRAALAAFLAVQVAFGLAFLTSPAVARIVDAMPDTHLGYDGAGLEGLIHILADDRATTWLLYTFDALNPTTGGAFLGLSLGWLLVATGHGNSRWR